MTDLALPPRVIAPPLGGVGLDVAPIVCRNNEEARVHALINRERTQRGLPKLMTSRILTATAQAWAKLMAQMGSIAHAYGPTEAIAEIRKAGYPNSWAGQNIAAGQPTPEAVVAAWMASPGHRDSILSLHFTEMGVGFFTEPDSKYRYYWSTDFGGGDTRPVRNCRG